MQIYIYNIIFLKIFSFFITYILDSFKCQSFLLSNNFHRRYQREKTQYNKNTDDIIRVY